MCESTLAADHLELDVTGQLLAPVAGKTAKQPTSPLKGWRIRVASRSPGTLAPTDPGVLVVLLQKNSARVQEAHLLSGFRGSLTFDGQTGRIVAPNEFSPRLVLRMTMRSTSAPVPGLMPECAGGSFKSTRVRVTGTLSLKTGTTMFKTVRAARLDGTLVYNDGPEPTCGASNVGNCTQRRTISGRAGDGVSSLMVGTEDGRPFARVSASTSLGGPAELRWTHALTVWLRVDPLVVTPLPMTARVPAGLPITGSLTYTPTAPPVGGRFHDPRLGRECTSSTTTGNATGSYSAVFSRGWKRIRGTAVSGGYFQIE